MRRTPSGLEGRRSSGRLRLAVLVATVAAFLLVPVSQAAAAGMLKVNITGPGKGKVTDATGATGNAFECSYSSPGPATGKCEVEMQLNGGGNEEQDIRSIAAAGSEVGKLSIDRGEDAELFKEFGPQYGCANKEGQKEIQEFEGFWLCGIVGEDEGKGGEVTVCFVLEGEGEAPCGPFDPTALTIAKSGQGSVVSNPSGIVCAGAKTGAECEYSFEKNEAVKLTASPAAGYAFSAWSGCLEHVGRICKVTMDKAKTVKVTFVATPSLTIQKAGSGSGKVAATGISCDESCLYSSSAVKTGTAVTVKTTPAKGNEAAVIEGGTGSASSCSGSTCTFTIEANSSLKVKFNPIPSNTLTVQLTGPAAYKGKVAGKGVVKTLLSSKISCGSGCTSATESFFATDEVELVASASTGYAFRGWTVSGGSAGTCTGTTTPCKLLTDTNKFVEAKFK